MKDYLYLLVIVGLLGALMWLIFNPPACPEQAAVDAAQLATRKCLEEKSALQTDKVELNNAIIQTKAERDAAVLRADQEAGKTDGLNETISRKNTELTAARESIERLAHSRDQLVAINQRIEARLTLLKTLKQKGTERSQTELEQLLAEEISGFLVLEGEG